jgi:serine/threonine protein kinase
VSSSSLRSEAVIGRRPYLVMDWLTGEGLSRRLTAGPLSPADSVRVVRAAASAMAAAHQAGVIHRDIKPSQDATERAPQTGFHTDREVLATR